MSNSDSAASTECKHEHTQKMWFEESYGFMGFIITQCADCGCHIDTQWYRSDDCGDHWYKIDDPIEGKKADHVIIDEI